MKTNWLANQIVLCTQQWDKNLTNFYPETKLWMKDDLSYFKQLTETCNYLKAVEHLDWNSYLAPGSMVLDVGCGGGWLTGYLSKNKKINKILAIDSSKNYLDNFVPSVVLQSRGDLSKVETVQGLFCPVLLENESVDMIVISSALHHADSLDVVLKEFYRVLKLNGYLLILNETPAGFFRFVLQTFKSSLKVIVGNFFKKYEPFASKIGIGSYLYDPYLGDVDYPEWYWKEAIASVGFDLIEVIDSKLATVANSKGRSLKHFVCKKLA